MALYTTIDYCHHVMSVVGIDLRVDDDPLFAEQVLLDTDTWVEEYCLGRYDTTRLQASEWIKRRAAEIAVYLFCRRRGNAVPASIATRFEEVRDRFEQVLRGSYRIPNMPAKKAMAPVLSNYRAQIGIRNRVLTQRDESTGNPEGYSQWNDWWIYPGFYVI